MNEAIVEFGSNIDPETNIKKAKEKLCQDLEVLGESKFITTKPVGYTEQPDFINGAVMLNTTLSTEELKSYLREVEVSLGRTYTENKFGPRTIDLDIIVWNNKIVDKDFYEREFIRNSVLELKPDLKF